MVENELTERHSNLNNESKLHPAASIPEDLDLQNATVLPPLKPFFPKRLDQGRIQMSSSNFDADFSIEVSDRNYGQSKSAERIKTIYSSRPNKVQF